MPSFDILLTPVVSHEVKGSYIDVSMSWDSPALQKDSVLLHHLLNRSGVLTAQYTADAIEFRGRESQVIALLTEGKRTMRNVHVKNDIPAGKLMVEYRVSPRYVDGHTKCGPQIAVEREDSGMSGARMAFILRPAGDEVFDVSID